MKSHSLLRSAAAFALMLFACNVNAQIAKNNAPLPASLSVPGTSNADDVLMDGLKLSNEKMHRNFTRLFKNPSNISINRDVKNTVVSFMQDDMRHNALFTNKGAWLQTIRYYEIDRLNYQVKARVASEFPDYDLRRVTEVNVGGIIAFLVDIENAKRYKTIRVVGEEWDVYKEYEKQR